MIVKLLTEHHLEFLNLTGGCTGSSESTLVIINNIAGKYMSRLKCMQKDLLDQKGDTSIIFPVSCKFIF